MISDIIEDFDGQFDALLYQILHILIFPFRIVSRLEAQLQSAGEVRGQRACHKLLRQNILFLLFRAPSRGITTEVSTLKVRLAFRKSLDGQKQTLAYPARSL